MEQFDPIEEMFKPLAQYSESPSDLVWDRIEDTIEKKKKGGLVWYISDGAILMFLIMLSFVSMGSSQKSFNTKLNYNKVEVQQNLEAKLKQNNASNAFFSANQNTAVVGGNKTTELKIENKNNRIYNLNTSNNSNFDRVEVAAKPTIENKTGISEPIIIELTPIKEENNILGQQYYRFMAMRNPKVNVGELENIKYSKLQIKPIFDLKPFRYKMISIGANSGLLNVKAIQTPNPNWKTTEVFAAINWYKPITKKLNYFYGIGFSKTYISGSISYLQTESYDVTLPVIGIDNKVNNFTYTQQFTEPKTEAFNALMNSVNFPLGIQYRLRNWYVEPSVKFGLGAMNKWIAKDETYTSRPVVLKNSLTGTLEQQLAFGRQIHFKACDFNIAAFAGMRKSEFGNFKNVGMEIKFKF